MAIDNDGKSKEHNEYTFETELNELKLWPYTIHTIDETLDSKLIQARAEQLLFQALNRRNLVAFIGSGVPMAYGRLSWNGWLQRQLDAIDEHAASFLQCCKTSSDTIESQIALLSNLRTCQKTDQCFDDTLVFWDSFQQINAKKELLSTILANKQADGTEQCKNLGDRYSGDSLDDNTIRILYEYLSGVAREINFYQDETNRLYRTFLHLRKDGFDSEEAPTVFEIAEKLQEMLLRNSALFIDATEFSSLDKSNESPQDKPSDKVADYGFCENIAHSRAPRIALTRWKDYLPRVGSDVDLSGELADVEKTRSAIRSYISNTADSDANASLAASHLFVADIVITLAMYRAELTKYRRIATGDDARSSVEETAKRLLIDECAHAEGIVERATEYSLQMGRSKWDPQCKFAAVNKQIRKNRSSTNSSRLSRQAGGVRGSPDRFWLLGFFKTESLLAVRKALSKRIRHAPDDFPCSASAWVSILDLIKVELIQNGDSRNTEKSRGTRIFVSPTHRYIFEVMLGLSENPYNDFCGWPGGQTDAHRGGADGIYRTVTPADFRSRYAAIDAELDPLDKIGVKLGIRQFLTTNYDFEIERYFEERSYNRFTQAPQSNGDHSANNNESDQESYRVDGLGGILKDSSFKRKKAAELISFSVAQEGVDASIFHLHGRASPESSLVVTERNYMDLYLKRDRLRSTVDESIHVAFSSNPILFIGLGMKEEDVLRPFRQFMSDKDRDASRTAIVLSAGTSGEAKRSQDAALRYVRYGVHTIFYGDGNYEVKKRKDANERVWVVIQWLRYFSELVAIIKDSAKTQLDGLLIDLDGKNAGEKSERVRSKAKSLRDDGNPKKIFEGVDSALGTVSIGDRKIRVLQLLFGAESKRSVDVGLLTEKDFLPPVDAPMLELCKFGLASETSSQIYPSDVNDGENHLEFEQKLVSHLFAQMIRDFYKGPSWDAMVCNSPYYIRDFNARIAALDGVMNTVHTATLCIALDNLETARSHWWQHWRAGPPERVARFRKRLPGKIQENTERARDCDREIDSSSVVQQPTRYIRHELTHVISPLSDTDLKVTKWRDSLQTAGGATGIRSFDNFVQSVGHRVQFDVRKLKPVDQAALRHSGRRLYVVAARRGFGKGSFMSAFASAKGFASYAHAAWSSGLAVDEVADCWLRPLYVSAVYINLSFSTEISSTFDMLASALIDSIVRINPSTDKDKIADALNEEMIGLNRVRKLERLFSYLSDQQCDTVFPNSVFPNRITRGQYRFLLCFSALELLHFDQGLPKNREVEQILSFLTSNESSQLPFDLILVSSERNLTETLFSSTPLRKEYEALNAGSTGAMDEPIPRSRNSLIYVPIARNDINQRGIQTIRSRQDASYIPFSIYAATSISAQSTGIEQRALGDLGRQRRINFDTVCFVHFARAMKPELFLADNYLGLAYALFVNYIDEIRRRVDQNGPLQESLKSLISERSDNKNSVSISANDRKRAWEESSRSNANLNNSKWRKTLRCSERKVAKQLVDFVKGLIAVLGDGDIPEIDETLKKLVAKIQKEKLVSKKGGEDKNLLTCARQIIGARYEIMERSSRAMSSNDGPSQAYREWRQIRTELGGNRYCMTIILAAAQAVALADRDLVKGAQLAEKFIRTTVDHVKTVGLEKREETVLHDVLDLYERFHQAAVPSRDNELHLIILRHLAVVGSPCSTDVLARVPQIRSYYSRVSTELNSDREQFLAEAMSELAERGWVFELAPHPRLLERFEGAEAAMEELRDQQTVLSNKRSELEVQGLDLSKNDDLQEINFRKLSKLIDDQRRIYGDSSPKYLRRYALHRLMQGHVIRKMGSGPRDSAQINSFSPSLYASMPADLPRLNQEAYAFLTELVSALSQYPDRKSALPSGENWYFGSASISTQVQALRAALSVVRSSFSVAVVSRFDDYQIESGAEELPERGYFEQYRVQIRWLIRKAYELLLNKPTSFLDYNSEASEHPHINAFYRDEIVWLYNECGVVNLVQGNLSDSASLLRQAISINRKIEGHIDGGAHHNRLSLNLAIAQIWRGRLEGARNRLNSICSSEAQESDRPGRVWHIAHGYLGLIHHLYGDSTAADQHYDRAIKVLRHYDDSRACALFCLYKGNLSRTRGDFSNGRQCLDESLRFAEAGGHEDMHKHTRIALVRFAMEKADADGSSLDVRLQLGHLKLVEDYALIMQMPGLLCDTKLMRARLMLRDGETTQAGQLLSQNITLARQNDMVLKLNSSLTWYAQVLAFRGLKGQSRQLLFSALEMAKRSHNQLEIQSIERAFERLDIHH